MKKSTFLLFVLFLPIICWGQNIIVQTANYEEVVDCWKSDSHAVVQWEDTICSNCEIPFVTTKYSLRPAKSTLIMLDYRWIMPGHIHGHGGWTVYLNLLKVPRRGKDLRIDVPSADVVTVIDSEEPYAMPTEQVKGSAEIHRPLIGRWKMKVELKIIDEDYTLPMPTVLFRAKRMPKKIAQDLSN